MNDEVKREDVVTMLKTIASMMEHKREGAEMHSRLRMFS